MGDRFFFLDIFGDLGGKKVDVVRFFGFLVILLVIVGVVGVVGLRIVDE